MGKMVLSKEVSEYVDKLKKELQNAHETIQMKEQALDRQYELVRVAQREKDAAEKARKDTQAEFIDLKIRLHSAEKANEFMRGYLARVQEDDVINEELVATGDPQGEQQLVPKRKSTQFPRPDDFTYPTNAEMAGATFGDRNYETRRRARHWITY